MIRFREAMTYERSVEIFKRFRGPQGFSGASAVVLELRPGASGGSATVSTPFKANVTAEVAEAVESGGRSRRRRSPRPGALARRSLFAK